MFIRDNYDVKLPVYETKNSAGMDVRAYLGGEECSIEVHPGEWALIPTGLRVDLPDGYELQVRPRSGLAYKHGITVINSPGTIDADYEGLIGILIMNHGDRPFKVQHGARIAQLVYKPVEQMPGVAVKETLRGSGGFNSTGVN